MIRALQRTIPGFYLIVGKACQPCVGEGLGSSERG
jgi:hypothetical protein